MSDLTPEDVALLQQARGGLEPAPDDQARVKRRLFAQLGIGLGATGLAAKAGAAATMAPTAGGLAAVAKIVVAVVLVGGAVATAGVMATSGSKTSGPLAPPPTPRLALTAAAPAAVTALAAETVSVASPPPIAPVQTPFPALPTAIARPTPSPIQNAPPRPAPLAEVTAQHSPTSSPPANPPQTEEPTGPSTVAAEAELLRRADEATRAGEPARALVLLQQHETSFPNGMLVQEREAERVIVLCALGRVGDARAAAAAFLRDRPMSPLVPRIKESCAGR